MATRAPVINSGKTTSIKISKLRPSALRLRFEEAQEPALEESIAKHGLLHPIVARHNGAGEYEVVCGHRRLEALRRIGVDEASCRIIEATDKEAFEISLVENLQRKSIDPVEEALAFHQYLDVLKWGNRRSLASRIGKSPEYVTHRLRILQLPQDVLSRVGTRLSASQAEELAWVGDEDASRRLANLTERKKISVQDLHALVQVEKKRRTRRSPGTDDFCDDMELPKVDQKGPGHLTSHAGEVLRTSIAALRYVMYYFGDLVDSMNGDPDAEALRRFLADERYKVHQIVDDFVSAQVKANRALRNGQRIPDLHPDGTTFIDKESF